MIPSFSNLYEEIPQSYFLDLNFNKRVVVCYDSPTFQINEEIVQGYKFIFDYANRQGLDGYLTRDFKMKAVEDIKDRYFGYVKISCIREKLIYH